MSLRSLQCPTLTPSFDESTVALAPYLTQCRLLGVSPHKQLVRWLGKVKPAVGVMNLSHLDGLCSIQLSCAMHGLGAHPEIRMVHTVCLNFARLNDLAAITVIQFATQRLPLLHTLELFGNTLTDQCCPALRSLLLSSGVNGGGGLQKLKLGDNRITCHGAIALSHGLVNNTSLATLHLGQNRIGDDGVLALAQALLRNSTLMSLCLRDNQFGPLGMSALCVVLANHPTLADVQLKGNAVFHQHSRNADEPATSIALMTQLSTVLRSHIHLRVLDLQQTGMTSSDAMALAQGLMHNPQIHAVNLNDNQIGDAGCEAIMINVLLQKDCAVATIGLRSNGIAIEGSKAIGKALLANTSLTGMDVAMNKLGDTGALMVGYALQFNTALQSLDIRDNSISGCGSRILAHALCCNRTLKHVDLSNNLHGDCGAQEWSKVLVQNATLTRLSMVESGISDLGGRALAEALQRNVALRYLGLESAQVTTPSSPSANSLSAGLLKAFRVLMFQRGGRMIADRSKTTKSIRDETPRSQSDIVATPASAIRPTSSLFPQLAPSTLTAIALASTPYIADEESSSPSSLAHFPPRQLSGLSNASTSALSSCSGPGLRNARAASHSTLGEEEKSGDSTQAWSSNNSPRCGLRCLHDWPTLVAKGGALRCETPAIQLATPSPS